MHNPVGQAAKGHDRAMGKADAPGQLLDPGRNPVAVGLREAERRQEIGALGQRQDDLACRARHPQRDPARLGTAAQGDLERLFRETHVEMGRIGEGGAAEKSESHGAHPAAAA
jgi:hypothetical protein